MGFPLASTSQGAARGEAAPVTLEQQFLCAPGLRAVNRSMSLGSLQRDEIIFSFMSCRRSCYGGYLSTVSPWVFPVEAALRAVPATGVAISRKRDLFIFWGELALAVIAGRRRAGKALSLLRGQMDSLSVRAGCPSTPSPCSNHLFTP